MHNYNMVVIILLIYLRDIVHTQSVARSLAQCQRVQCYGVY